MAALLPDGDDAISFPGALVRQQTCQKGAQSALWLDINLKLRLVEFITDEFDNFRSMQQERADSHRCELG